MEGNNPKSEGEGRVIGSHVCAHEKGKEAAIKGVERGREASAVFFMPGLAGT